jgi:hypothetical protein
MINAMHSDRIFFIVILLHHNCVLAAQKGMAISLSHGPVSLDDKSIAV